MAIGMAAVKMLISSIQHNDFGLPNIRRPLLIEGVWVDGSPSPHHKEIKGKGDDLPRLCRLMIDLQKPAE
jgi:hypothetical protein